MMMFRIARRLSLSALTLVLIACRSQPATEMLTPREIAAISPGSGAVSHDLVPDAESPQVELGPGEEFVAPQLDPRNPQPAYPSELIPLGLGPHAVVLRVLFDESGRTSDVSASPLGTRTESEYQSMFEAAVRKTVSDWRCWPPSIRKFRPGPDSDGDGKADFQIMADQRFLKTYFDVAFTFRVVNGVPVVNSGESR